ncbi:MAG TPA: ribonuclease P protein component [Actinomycetota bacterium]|nr:ribonuclease P protein component [Actinomycetota bacterium]
MSPRLSLARSADFRRVYRSGKRARRDGITVWVARGDEPHRPTRLGLAVRATIGTAVIRNRVRRRLRAAFRAYEPATGFDVVARGDTALTGRNFQQMQADLWAALEAAGLRGRAG